MAIASRKDKYYLLSLGCSKNTVDSESIAQVLNQSGMKGTDDPRRAEIMIVNTCGFINSAKQESIDALRELVTLKRGNQMVIAAGCLSQRYGENLVQDVPGLDGIIGTRRWMDIFDLVTRLRDRKTDQPDVLMKRFQTASTELNEINHAAFYAPAYRGPAPISRSPMAAVAHVRSALSRRSKALLSAVRWKP